jgi:2-polyprenyl-3-methyl-5-hydroxy-6-metoxy-1,4-benzoquinol methylase
LKINIGDIYRDQKSKYDFVGTFSSEKILDITFGKFFDFAKSELLFLRGAKEIWNLDLLNDDQYVTIRKINNSGTISFEKRNISELWHTKFNLILSFNVLRITFNMDSILKIIQNCLLNDGLAIISILNNDALFNNHSNLISSKEKSFSIKNFENKLDSFFHDVDLFSQGEILQMEKYSKNIKYKKNTLGNITTSAKKIFKVFFNSNNALQFLYLNYLRPLYLPYKNFRR